MPVTIDSPSCQRALIAIGPVSQVRVPRPIQRTATFLTQLLADRKSTRLNSSHQI